jgi:hypothetical protein
VSVFLDISAALDARLATLTNSPPVAWSNRVYEPVTGTLYLRPTHLPSDTSAATIGGTASTDLNPGIYQVDVFAPAGEGKNEAYVMADLVADHLKRDTELTYNSRTIRIKNVSIAPALQDGGWYQVPVTIEYYSLTVAR